MEEKYKNKMIDKSRYSVVNINDNKMSEEEMKEKGYVFMPYICVEHTEESSKEYDDFMKEYHKQHECCPKCGETGCTTTLVGYVLNMDKKEEYKDLNKCVCSKCGDKHTIHDRVPSIEALS
jgi:hypothetical protein